MIPKRPAGGIDMKDTRYRTLYCYSRIKTILIIRQMHAQQDGYRK